MDKMEKCVFCDRDLSDGQSAVVLSEKGSSSVNQASEQRGSAIRTQKGQRVHKQCREVFTHPTSIAKDRRNVTSPEEKTTCTLRSAHPAFNFKDHCLFCGKGAKSDGRI